jgi:hypothetical protein
MAMSVIFRPTRGSSDAADLSAVHTACAEVGALLEDEEYRPLVQPRPQTISTLAQRKAIEIKRGSRKSSSPLHFHKKSDLN